MDQELDPLEYGAADEAETELLHTGSGLAAGVNETFEEDENDEEYPKHVLREAAARLQVAKPQALLEAKEPRVEDSSILTPEDISPPSVAAAVAVAEMIKREFDMNSDVYTYDGKEPCVEQRPRIRRRKELEGPVPKSHVDQGYEVPMWHPFNKVRPEAHYASYKQPWPTEAINEFRREVWQPDGFAGTLDDLERVVDYRLAWHMGAIGAKVMLMSGRRQLPVYITIDGTDCECFLRIQTKPVVVLAASELWDIRYDGVRNALHLLNEEACRKCHYAYKLVRANSVRHVKRSHEILRDDLPEEPPVREVAKTVIRHDLYDFHHAITDRLASVGRVATPAHRNTSHILASSASESSDHAAETVPPKLTAFEKELLAWAGTHPASEVSEETLRVWLNTREQSSDTRGLLEWLDRRFDVRSLAPAIKLDRGVSFIKDLKDYVLRVSAQRDLLGPPDQGSAVVFQHPSPTMLEAAAKEKPRPTKLHLAPTRFVEAILVLVWESRVQTALLKYFQ